MPGAVVAPVALACLPILDLGVLNLSAFHPQEFSPRAKLNWKMTSNLIGNLTLGLQCAREAGRQMTEKHPELKILSPAPANLLPSHISDLILDFMPHGVCILDAKGKVVRVNRSIEKLQGGCFKK